jgi:protein-tyrosine phosphatase
MTRTAPGTIEGTNGMLDLHCHILPGVDDGPATLDEAMALARFSVNDGITHITATPHCNRSLRLLRADILPQVARFNEALTAARLPLTVLPGSEIQITTSDDYKDDIESGRVCHLGDGQAFTLLEFSWHAEDYPSDAAEVVVWLRRRGLTPIVAHPERQGFLRDHPTRLDGLVQAGAWLQVTVDSLLGNHGQAAQAGAWNIVPKYPDCVLATDAHNKERCSGLSVGYAAIQKRLGQQRAEQVRARADHVLARLLAR